jgi:hypothetical protein
MVTLMGATVMNIGSKTLILASKTFFATAAFASS